MTREMTPEQFAAWTRRLPESVRDAQEVALLAAGRNMVRLADRYSSGVMSTADLRRAGHPFARRRGAPQADPTIINQQTRGEDSGESFREGWQLGFPAATPEGMEIALRNNTPQAGFLGGGTRTMFARPVHERILNEVAPTLGPLFLEELTRRLGG